MAYDIIIGRDENDKKKFGKEGAVFLGKTYVQMGRVTSLANNVYLDVARNHTILVVGKRGSGKSYSLSVMCESILDFPEEIKNNMSIIIFDTMGIFWTMKYPNKKDENLLEEWGMQAKGFDVDLFVPKGYFQDYKEGGIPADYEFALQPKLLNAGDWCGVFNIEINSDDGVLISRVVKRLSGDYSIKDILDEIEDDEKSEQRVKYRVQGLFIAANTWGLFDEDAVDLAKIADKGRVNIIDLSAYSQVSGNWNIKALVAGIVCNKLLAERIIYRKKEEVESIEKGYSIFKEEENKSDLPLLWIFIDECLPYDALIETNFGKMKIGQLVEKIDSGESILVRGYDKGIDQYNYYKVNKTYKIAPRETIKLETETGNFLNCTLDHPILTREGFVNACNAKDLAFPLDVNYHMDYRRVLFRIIGHILGDGYLTRLQRVGFCGKGKGELELIKRELGALGIHSSKIYSRITKSQITDAKNRIYTVVGVSQEMLAGRKAFAFFKQIGLPIGKKTEQRFSVPEFIMNGTSEEKSEFLSTLMGADGYGLTFSNRSKSDYNAIRFSFNKIEELENDGWAYAKQIVFLFNDVGIEVSSIKRRSGNIRKDGKRTIKFVITLKKDTENTIRFIEKVGFKYNPRKELNSRKWLSYLRFYKQKINKLEKIRNRALELHREGMSSREISKLLGIYYQKINDWTYRTKQVTVGWNFESFEEYIKKRCVGRVLYEEVKNIELLPPESLFDIDVESVHNFVANETIVHNCHNFLSKEKTTPATESLISLLREGRQPGISLVLATQQPAKVHDDVLTQADIVLCHRVTAKQDVDALNAMMQSYMEKGLTEAINELPREDGAGVILDDVSERIYPLKVRPKFSWHGGEAPSAIKKKKKLELDF